MPIIPKIEEAKDEYLPKIAEIQGILWLSSYVNEKYGIAAEDIKAKDFTSEKRIKGWGEKIRKDGYKMWVVKNNTDEVVGFCTAEKGEKMNAIGVVYILPEYQGQGLGTILVNQAISWLGKEKDIFLDVVEFNERAIKLYERLGFKKAGPTPKEECSVLPSGKIMPEMRMIMPAQGK